MRPTIDPHERPNSMTGAMIRMAGAGLTILLLLLGGLAAQEAATARPRETARPHDRAQSPADKARTSEKTEKTERPSEKPSEKDRDKDSTKAKERTTPAAEKEPVVTHHRVKIGESEIRYTATAGLMPILDAKGEPEARIFFMAYTRDDAGPSTSRPLLFSFNGGPGSSSVWLHMGALGPRRVAMPDGPTIPAPPYHLVDNDATWLDCCDLVFIDPVGTGYSRAAKPELNSKFHSLRGDIASVGEFIRMYLTRYDRWTSPLFVIGESYGTTRAAGLSGHLLDDGIALSGVILVSCALDYQGFITRPGNDLAFLNYLPSYAASAWYHKRLPDDLQRLELPALLKEVEAWVDREYTVILARGDRLTDNDRHAAAERLARYTGLKVDDIEDHELRIDSSFFRGRLLRSQHRSIGRYDARYRGIENRGPSADGVPGNDPSYDAVHAAYTTTFNHYVRDELGYKSDVTYNILGGGVGRWDYQTNMGYPATTSQLREALSQNPHMRVLIASGYFDLATPYRAVEHSVAGLGLDPSIRGNIAVEYFKAGHMMYLHGPSLKKLKHDGAALIERAITKK